MLKNTTVTTHGNGHLPELSVALNPKLEFSHLIDSILMDLSVNYSSGHFSTQEKDLWKLCSALWDRIPASEQLDSSTLSTEQVTNINEALRKEEFSHWLKSTVKPSIDEEVQDASSDGKSPDAAYTKSLFTLLSGRQMARAVKEAMDHRDYKLAAVLAQIGGAGSRLSNGQSSGLGVIGRIGTDPAVLEFCSKQISVWKDVFEQDNRSSSLFDKDRLLCWTLCSGEIDDMLPLFKDDWKRSFSLMFWFKEGGIYSIKEIVKHHMDAVSAGKSLYL
jgi:hypothetical protein